MSDEDVPVRIPPKGKRGGRWITFGDEAYRVPPLGFREVQDLEEDVKGLAAMQARPTPPQMAVVARIVHAAMARNYPDLKVDEVLDMLDFGNYQDVLFAVLAVAGFSKEATDGPGEARASTGTPPTAP